MVSYKGVGLVFLLLLLPVFATYTVSLQQWENLNMTTSYVNEFMVCILENDTSLIWDTYQSGEVEFTTAEINDTFNIYCCDNCRVEGSTIYLAPNSLEYWLDYNVSIYGNTDLDYYVGDVLELLRISNLVTNTSFIGDMDFEILAGLVMLIISTVGLPFMLFGFLPDMEQGKVIMFGGGLGFLVGLTVSSAFGLFDIGQTIGIFIVGIIFMFSLGKLAGG